MLNYINKLNPFCIINYLTRNNVPTGIHDEERNMLSFLNLPQYIIRLWG